MTEIEKLYENAEIENNCKLYGNYSMCPYKTRECTDCKYFIYPPFTAEKQIEITKFLLKKAVYYDVKDDKYWFYYEECESVGYKPFEVAIAHFINKLWQDLTEQEKEQIKEILE